MEEKEIKYKISLNSNLENENFNKSNSFINKFYKDLHINEIRIINTLIFIFDSFNNKHQKQKEIGEYFKNIVFNNGYFRIKFKDMKKHIQDNNNISYFEMVEHLKNIKSRNIEYIRTVEENGKYFKKKSYTSFILNFDIFTPKDIFKSDIYSESFFDFYLDKNLYHDIFNLKNSVLGYTKFNINMNKLNSKLGIGLYEELTRITPLKKIKKGKVQEYDYTEPYTYNLDKLNELFNTNYKYISKMKSKIEVQYKKLLKMELLKDIYIFEYSRNELKISIKRNILKEMFEKEGVMF